MMLASDQTALVQLFKESVAAKKRDDRVIEDDINLRVERDWLQRHDAAQREASDEMARQATEAQLAAFHEQLDRYDTATVQALMENEQQLDAVRKQEDELQRNAYTLPDGRKVFRTEDGVHIYDQSGTEVADIDPQSIPRSFSSWDKIESARTRKTEIEERRTAILDFQQRNDSAQKKLAKGGATSEDITKMGEALKDAMPEEVRHELGDAVPAQVVQPPTYGRAVAQSGVTPDPLMARML